MLKKQIFREEISQHSLWGRRDLGHISMLSGQTPIKISYDWGYFQQVNIPGKMQKKKKL